jgi:hypothetical protein
MKHCWHPTGESRQGLRVTTDKLVCCWCGTPGVQKCETERVLTEGHGQHYVKLVKVRRPVKAKSERCTTPRANQLGGSAPTGEKP